MKTLLLTFLTLTLIGCGAQNSGHNHFIESDIVIDKNRIWPSGYTIPVAIFEDEETLNRHAKKLRTDGEGLKVELQEVLNLWTRYANVEFDFVGNKKNLTEEQKQYPHVIITFTKNPRANWANVGPSFPYSSGYNMSLGGLVNTTYLRKATIAHEFGHVLGFKHEHQHPQRQISIKDLALNCKKSGFTKELCKSQMYDVAKEDQVFLLPYDSNSIMHYEFTITEPENKIIGGNGLLSINDKYAAAQLYPGKIESLEQLQEMHKEDMEISKVEIESATNLRQCAIVLPKSCPKDKPFNIVSKVSGQLVLRKCLPSATQVVTVLNSIDLCH